MADNREVVIQEVYRRAHALIAKDAAIEENEAVARVFRDDIELYHKYARASSVGGASIPQGPHEASPCDELTQEVRALARTFSPSDPDGLGLLKARVAIGELHKTVLRKKGVAI